MRTREPRTGREEISRPWGAMKVTLWPSDLSPMTRWRTKAASRESIAASIQKAMSIVEESEERVGGDVDKADSEEAIMRAAMAVRFYTQGDQARR